MASQPKMSMKRRRNVLTLVQKIEILDKIKSGDTVASLARKYGMNESSVREIRKNEVTIRRSVVESAPISSKTCFITRDVMVEKTEKALNIWIEDQTQKKVPLSSIIIREKAKQLHQHFTSSSKGDSKNSSFLASKGWFEKFKNRCNLHNVKLVGESASADHLAATHFPIELKNVHGGYTPNEPKQSKDDEEEKEPVKPDFSSKSIKEIFSLAHRLTEQVLQTDPLTERALKFKRGIQELLVPYEEVRKDIENKRKQTLITIFFHPS